MEPGGQALWEEYVAQNRERLTGDYGDPGGA
jgi:hypothetical protein